MCGIFAWSGKDPKKFNKDKFDKLGIFNIDRGKDSCGVSFDGDIYYGLNTEKLYSKFIVNRNIRPEKYPVVIGHTRSASVGNIVNERNAHPFGFGNNSENDYEFIGCHNGTLYNHKDLASTFKINTEEKVKVPSDHLPAGFYEQSRQKIDSEILLEIIYKTKNFKVLSQYNGAAALVFTNTNEPNVVYVWKGASKQYDYLNNEIEEERPLFYYMENENSLYISSIQESLETIGGTANVNLFSFNHNTIYKITDGDIEHAEKTKISRNDQFQKEIVKNNNAYYPRNNYSYWEDVYDDGPYPKKNNHSNVITLPASYDNKSNCKVKDNVVTTNVYNECLSKNQNEYLGRVYFNKFRYNKNGHLITGIFTWINNYGYFKIGEGNLEEARRTLNGLVGVPFIKNDFVFNTKELDLTNDITKQFIPFKFKSQVEHNMYYFIQGVKVLTKLDYSVTHSKYHESHIKKGLIIDYAALSEISTHPVIDISVSSRPDNCQNIILKGKIVEKISNFFILGSDRSYNIEKGNLISIKSNKHFDNFIFGSDIFKSVKSLEDLIKLTTNVKEDKDLLTQYLKEDDINYVENETSLEINIDDDSSKELKELNKLINESCIETVFDLEDIVENLEKLNTSKDIMIDKKIADFKAVKDYMLTLID